MVSEHLELLLGSPGRCGVIQMVVTGIQPLTTWTASSGALTAIYGEDSQKWPDRRRRVIQGEVLDTYPSVEDVRRAIAELPVRALPYQVYEEYMDRVEAGATEVTHDMDYLGPDDEDEPGEYWDGPSADAPVTLVDTDHLTATEMRERADVKHRLEREASQRRRVALDEIGFTASWEAVGQ
jgi:hypothetical protein